LQARVVVLFDNDVLISAQVVATGVSASA